jgi:hypothetical protein
VFHAYNLVITAVVASVSAPFQLSQKIGCVLDTEFPFPAGGGTFNLVTAFCGQCDAIPWDYSGQPMKLNPIYI